MMTHFASQDSKSLFDEIAIADLAHCQIAVLTTTRTTNRGTSLGQRIAPRRLYQTQGWLSYRHQIIAHFDELKVGSIFTHNLPLKSIQRIAPAVPISFQVKSSQPLPTQVCAQSTFVCELPKTDFPYHAVFRQIRPRFVRIYPFEGIASLLEKVAKMLQDRDYFIAENYQQLKRVPFYQDSFKL